MSDYRNWDTHGVKSTWNQIVNEHKAVVESAKKTLGDAENSLKYIAIATNCCDEFLSRVSDPQLPLQFLRDAYNELGRIIKIRESVESSALNDKA